MKFRTRSIPFFSPCAESADYSNHHHGLRVVEAANRTIFHACGASPQEPILRIDQFGTLCCVLMGTSTSPTASLQPSTNIQSTCC